mgnify:FL=1
MIRDILLGENDEWLVREGTHDVLMGEGDTQVCDLLATSATGEWKNAPLCGWNIRAYSGAPQSAFALLKPQIMEDLRRNNISGMVVMDKGVIDIRL